MFLNFCSPKLKTIAIFYLTFILYSYSLVAQNVGVNTDNPDPSAILDIVSNEQGILIPRLDSINIMEIPNPPEGLFVYDKEFDVFRYYDGTAWQKLRILPISMLEDLDMDTKVYLTEAATDSISFKIDGADKFIFTSNALIVKDDGDNLSIGENTANSSGSGNLVIGANSAPDLSTGVGNVGIGSSSLNQLTAGSRNVAIGATAMLSATDAHTNVAIGNNALRSSLLGVNNVAVGYRSGFYATGSGNVFLGKDSGFNELGDNRLYIDNTSTSSPLIFGDFTSKIIKINGTLNINDAYSFPSTNGSTGQILELNSMGDLEWADQQDNQSIDTMMLDGSVLKLSLSGDNLPASEVDLAIIDSPKSFIENASGSNKVYTEKFTDEDVIRFDVDGEERMSLSLSDDGSVPILELNSTNTVIGKFSAQGLDIDDLNNTIIGAYAGRTFVGGDNNVFVGHGAGGVIPSIGGGGVTFGSNNVYIGNQAGGAGNGDNNIYIGNKAGYTFGFSNRLMIDNTGTSAPLIFGNFTTNKLEINGFLNMRKVVSGEDNFVTHIKNLNDNNDGVRDNGLKITAGSSTNAAPGHRFIEFFRPDGTAIASIRQNGLNSVNYDTNSDKRLKTNIEPTSYGLEALLKIDVKDYEFIGEKDNVYTGFLAQQLYEHYPEAVLVGGENPKTDPWRVDYGRLTPIIIKAIQEKQAIINAQEKEIDRLLTDYKKLYSAVEQLKSKLDTKDNSKIELLTEDK